MTCPKLAARGGRVQVLESQFRCLSTCSSSTSTAVVEESVLHILYIYDKCIS